MFLRTQTTAGRTCLLLVENERVSGRIKQRVLHRLGRFDQLQASGQIDSLLASLGRFSTKLAVLGAHDRGHSVTTRTRRIGASLIFERLWREIGIADVLHDMLREHRLEFALGRAVFITLLHRLFVSGSDRAAERWMREQVIAGIEGLSLHHLYRTMGFLGEPLTPPTKDASCFDLRTRKDLIAEELFARRRDLFTDVEFVFFDTTSIYFEGEGSDVLGQRGHSKDHQPDLARLSLLARRISAKCLICFAKRAKVFTTRSPVPGAVGGPPGPRSSAVAVVHAGRWTKTRWPRRPATTASGSRGPTPI